jgi:T-complex protein 11
MLIPASKNFTEHLRTALKYAVSHPPVTTATLIKLDLNWILHNMNLRSDINFETDLHFMPVKGKHAEQKGKQAQQYWLALAAELQIHIHNRVECAFSDGLINFLNGFALCVFTIPSFPRFCHLN